MRGLTCGFGIRGGSWNQCQRYWRSVLHTALFLPTGPGMSNATQPLRALIHKCCEVFTLLHAIRTDAPSPSLLDIDNYASYSPNNSYQTVHILRASTRSLTQLFRISKAKYSAWYRVGRCQIVLSLINEWKENKQTNNLVTK